MFWRKSLQGLGNRLKSLSTSTLAKSTKEKVIHSQVEKVCGDKAHKLHGLAKEIMKLEKDAEEILMLTQEEKGDKEFQSMAENDLRILRSQIDESRRVFLHQLVDSYRLDPVYENCSEVLLEVSPGVGGQEAMLFSKELMDLYSNFAEYKQWEVSSVNYAVSEIGGLRHGSLLISSSEAYKLLNLETGVHRVQRIPKTEKAGRVHTSTSTVSILPTIDDSNIKIDDKDLRIETKRASGAGGQHVNTTESAVRITHLPTGLSVDCQTERSQIRNRQQGMKLLISRVHKLEYEKNLKLSKDLKKMQIGLGERSDKIRTYNYLQDRVTDHRYSFTSHNVQGILEGRENFDAFLDEIRSREVDRVLGLL